MTAVRSVLRRHLLVALILALSVPMLAPEPAHAVDKRPISEIRSQIQYLINRKRVRNGLPRLRVNSRIQYHAQKHARKMKRRRAVFHDSNLRHEIPAKCTAWAENVARTGADNAARSAMTMFMNSSAHRANILSKRMNRMGIGVARGGGKVYIVQRFADC